jgi:CTP synthase (UTP-ammonia lyase)
VSVVRIGIVGDFDRGKHSHWATEAALFHAAAKLDVSVEPEWIGTTEIAAGGGAWRLQEVDGIWASPGSPYKSLPGMLAGIEFARVHDVPFLGTCGGFQYALIEFTRNVLGIADADTAENETQSRNIVITPIACEAPLAGRPRLEGAGSVRPLHGTQLERLCGSRDLRGEYFCSFETNRDFVGRWEAAGMRVAALGDGGEMRALELPGKRFFVATLFQPQLSSAFGQPHPIIVGYVEACTAARRALST